ncbi:hypothetical protein EYF80_027377 [Liparis tanakae]|uniref:Uncharacterized protein n=1 Tax=Liparis tanakae TaxID=230148 RepID=A0A4Z2H9C2_9TELE|nr:hypothetical protein EYF80_027377 [Liparis tanakae]
MKRDSPAMRSYAALKGMDEMMPGSRGDRLRRTGPSVQVVQTLSASTSPTATNTDSTSPAASTMKMPPMFCTPRALASLLSSSGQPFPLHHFSFIMCSFPSSWSCRMAIVILSLYGDPANGPREDRTAQHRLSVVTTTASLQIYNCPILISSRCGWPESILRILMAFISVMMDAAITAG